MAIAMVHTPILRSTTTTAVIDACAWKSADHASDSNLNELPVPVKLTDNDFHFDSTINHVEFIGRYTPISRGYHPVIIRTILGPSPEVG